MNIKSCSAILATLGLLVAGCTSSRIVTMPYATSLQEGVPYYLPASEYKISAKFAVFIWEPEKPKEEETGGEAKEPKPADESSAAKKGDKKAVKQVATGPAQAVLVLSDEADALTVEEKTVADPSKDFFLRVETSPWMVTSGLEISLSDLGLLNSVNAAFEDKRAAIIGNAVDSALSLASALKSSETTPAGKWVKSAVTYTVQKTVKASDLLAGRIENFFGPQINEIMEGGDYRLIAAHGPYTFQNLDGKTGYPKIDLQLRAAKNHAVKMTAVEVLGALSGGKSDGSAELPGVIYRAANPGVLSIHIGKTAQRDWAVNVADAAPIHYIEYRGRSFTKRTTKVEFGNAKGISKYSLDAPSSAENLSNFLKSNLNEVIAHETKAKAERDKERLDELTQERKVAGLEGDLRIVEHDIVQAERDLAEAEDKDKPAKRKALLTLQKQRDELLITIRAAKAGITLP